MMICREDEEKLMREAKILVDRLSELGCDSVALFMSWPTEDMQTAGRVIRSGNFYAQRGHVKCWLDDNKFEDQAEAIAHHLEE